MFDRTMEIEKVTKIERLLNLISFMLRSSQPVPFSAIAGQVVGYDDDARLDTIEKRFDRDKAELRNMGIPVDYVDTGSVETSGYTIPRQKFFLGPIELDGADAVLLGLASRSGAVKFAGRVMKEAFRSALRKLAVDTPEVGQIPDDGESMLQLSSGHARASDVLPVVCSAVFSRRCLRFAYLGHHDTKPVRRSVEPYGLGVSDGEWYLVGRDIDRNGIRMFKLARVRGMPTYSGASDSGPEFTIPNGFRVRDHLHRYAWDFGDDPAVAVRVRMPHALGDQVRRQFKVETESEDDDHVVLVFDARAPVRLVDQVFSWGPQARILGPTEVVDVARRRLEEMLLAAGSSAAKKAEL